MSCRIRIDRRKFLATVAALPVVATLPAIPVEAATMTLDMATKTIHVHKPVTVSELCAYILDHEDDFVMMDFPLPIEPLCRDFENAGERVDDHFHQT